MRWCRPVSVLSLALLALGNPISSILESRSQTGLPLALSALTNGAKALALLGAAGVEEIELLVTHLLDLANGKTAPVSTAQGALSALSNLDVTLNQIEYTIELAARGLLPTNILNLLEGLTDDQLNSVTNNNPRSPTASLYPRKSSQDAPYSVDEKDLRSALYIPDTFEYGANGKTPVLLVPGTAVPAGFTYHFGFAKLLAATDFADPVWVNIPGNSLDDIQLNAQYVAYAINYLSDVSNNAKIGLISWSQGGVDAQWAFKYWPSTREVVQDFMPVSPDFHGSLIGLTCLGFPSPACTPAEIQQGYNADLINTLRADGGDSAYVPTTSMYSSFDEIVEPQRGADASAYLLDAHNVGVTNNQVQLVCPGQVAGSIYTHESMLVNPVAWALVVDALTHDGPGQASRIDRNTVCGQFLPPGLTIDDFLGTEATNVLAIVDVLEFGSWTSQEPPIMPYAQSK